MAEKTDPFKVEMYTPETPAGKYDAHVQALIDADSRRTDIDIAEGRHASIVVTFPKYETNRKGEPRDAVAKYTRYFQDSANAAEKTAKVVDSIDQDDDTVNIRFILVDQQKRPRKALAGQASPAVVKVAGNENDAPKTAAA